MTSEVFGRRSRLLAAIRLVLLAVAAAGVAVTLFGRQSYHWRAFAVELAVQPSLTGRTRVVLTPLGEVRAATHRAPVTLTLALTQLHVAGLWQLVAAPSLRTDLEQEFRQVSRRVLNDFVVRQILIGAIGALIATLALRPRRPAVWGSGTLIGGGTVAVALAATLHGFDRRAFDIPTYTGSLQQAGAILSLAREGFDKSEALSSRLRQVARNIQALYGRLNGLPSLASGEEEIRVLHISDLHNNPAAVEFVRELAERFQVDAVIDTGDLTDFGTAVETELARGLARLPAPYLFVAGNHDSGRTVRAVGAFPNAILLTGQIVTVAGLRVLGLPDPASARPAMGDVNTPPEALRGAGEQLLALFERAPAPPEIVCVHNPRQAEPLIGRAPLILCGHMHRMELKTEQGTLLCNAGTTGGAGARFFYRDEGVPFSAAVLTFARQERPRLLYVDQVALDPSLSQYSLRRHAVDRLGRPRGAPGTQDSGP